MMTPERARALRDALRHRHPRQRDLLPQNGSGKYRQLYFDRRHPDAAKIALQLLIGIDGLKISSTTNPFCLNVQYDLSQFTLEGLEKALTSHGFLMDGSLYRRCRHALIYFLEDTQLRNMRMPPRLLKKSNEVYVKAWEHHQHGDHDDTPPDLREER